MTLRHTLPTRFILPALLLLAAGILVALALASPAWGAAPTTTAQVGPGALPTSNVEPLPAGVSVQTVLTGMVQPVALAFDPEGRLFYTERSGAVRLYAGGSLQPSPVITFPNIYQGNTCIESRLLGIAVDPDFSSNRYVYVFYTAPQSCNFALNRVVRFVENGGIGTNPTAIFTSPQTGTVHQGGILKFGPDGKLYVSIGDDYNAPNAQDLAVVPGKIHRINRDGTIPGDNPVFTQTGALRSIYALGFRNPFGMAFDTLVPGRMFVSENGPECDDELNRVERGYNYGWRSDYPCDDANPNPTYNTVAPLWHTVQGLPAAPTGVEVYKGNRIPGWRNELFMCSYADRKLRHFRLNPDRTLATSVGEVQGVACTMDLQTGPDGALYYIEGGGYAAGSLKRVVGPPVTPTPVACANLVGKIVPSANADQSRTTLSGVTAISANDVWAVGSSHLGTLIVRWNGEIWSSVPSPNVGSLSSIEAISSNNVWAVGEAMSRTLTMRWNGSAWQVVSSPNSSAAISHTLTDVSGLSANNVWAVGYYNSSNGVQTLVMRWNGTQWDIIPGTGAGMLYSVEAIAQNDVWAVGNYTDSNGNGKVLTMHWDGALWSRTSIPNIPNSSELRSIAAVSSNNIWAVGQYYRGYRDTPPLIIHWDGRQWSMVQSPDTYEYNLLSDVVAISSNNVWALGTARSYLEIGPFLLHWDGALWTTVDAYGPGSNESLFHIAGVSADSIWAVGSSSAQPYGNVENRAIVEHWDGTQWGRAYTSNLAAPQSNTLRAVSARASNDIWAVGSFLSTRSYALIEHWDGQSWSVSKAYDPGFDYALSGVAIEEANDVWAVGNYLNSFGDAHNQTLIERWDGTQWNMVPSPNVGSSDNILRGVSALSPTEVWAVGYYSETYQPQLTIRPLIMRWDGTQWGTVPTPDFGVGSDARLISVDTLPNGEVWAVGNLKPTPSGAEETLIMRWNGSAWSRVPSPSVAGTLNFLRGVSALSPSDVWAVGYYGPRGTGQSLVQHWNGQAWSIVPSPNAGDASFLLSVEAVAANDVWAVGNGFVGGVARSLVMRWDGQSWKVVSNPNGSIGPNYLWGVAAVSPSEVWTVGDYTDGGVQRTMTQRFAPPTFTDVPTTNTFYPSIQCIACKGADVGYPCGGPGEPCDTNRTPYYRPNTPITRDNIARMVAASAGFNEPAGAQRFQDVPPTNPYYAWVQRMANRGLIGGYPCGGPGEPCFAPNNRPYYRPSANATRGQIAKIVANGAGFTEPPSGQLFQDVPPTQTFYEWVQRLASRGVMGGYPCGGAGEPCVTPNNRPYFRWGANATRGQTSKITANTFFPACNP